MRLSLIVTGTGLLSGERKTRTLSILPPPSGMLTFARAWESALRLVLEVARAINTTAITTSRTTGTMA